ncbi:Dabb family protein [Streptomyces zingiberis]|uniref:Dabb family protein n=1 Tax=Streptomyces zingiberis TaxID=2053010 RepID=A0ABX1BXB4_9ACTN|nr:Dabb family protein [Streptomyces zingiberis]NJQ01106.1 Dabb family protein [Streptomyces zingiberis]
MIRHIVLFKFKPGVSWDDPRAREAERVAAKVGGEVPELHEWKFGRNISGRAVAYDYAVIGLVDDEAALERYMVHPFHQEAIRLWREISDWNIADLEE